MQIRLKVWVMAVLIVFIINSCVTQKKCLQRFPPQVTSDSTYVEKVRLVPVNIPGFSQRAEAPINCPDQNILLIDNNKLRQELEILNGKIISNTTVKPDSTKVPVKETSISVNEIKIPPPVKYIPKLYKASLKFSIFIIGFVVLFGVWKMYRFLRS